MKLIWMDLETTGLDPHRDRILELAFAVADLESPFSINDSHWSCVLHYDPIEADQEGLSMTDLVYRMHLKSGLLTACANSTLDISHPFHQLEREVPEEEDPERKPVLAGASVHFDLSFLRAWMPSLAQRFSHRVYDVSAVKLFCRSLGMPKIKRGEAHRAMADMEESIEQAKMCRDWLGTWGVSRNAQLAAAGSM